MGLDWNPGGRPKPGHEAEFEAIMRRIDKGDYAVRQSLAKRVVGFFAGRKQAVRPTLGELQARYDEISTTPHETLKAPRVGYDEADDRWAREKFRNAQTEKSEEEWLEALKGYYVLDLVEPCDGFPAYSMSAIGGAERFSFRAKFLEDCEEIIDNGEFDLFMCSYHSMTASETLAHGEALLKAAEVYARAHDIDLANLALKDPDTDDPDTDDPDTDGPDTDDPDTDDPDTDDPDTDDPDTDEFKLAVVLAAGRWCVFWGERGHHLDPDY